MKANAISCVAIVDICTWKVVAQAGLYDERAFEALVDDSLRLGAAGFVGLLSLVRLERLETGATDAAAEALELARCMDAALVLC
jgi:hypothetical protein